MAEMYFQKERAKLTEMACFMADSIGGAVDIEAFWDGFNGLVNNFTAEIGDVSLSVSTDYENRRLILIKTGEAGEETIYLPFDLFKDYKYSGEEDYSAEWSLPNWTVTHECAAQYYLIMLLPSRWDSFHGLVRDFGFIKGGESNLT